MPASRRKAAAYTRALYTGEKLTAAQAGIARDHSMGLDACRPEQHEFRALLAFGYLNHGVDYDGPAGWHLSVLSSYTLTVSPRFERVVLITDVPHNVASRLLRGPNGGNGLPGLRVEEHRGYGSYVMRHLPTGAQLVITNNPSGTPAGARNEPYIDYLTADTPLTSAERDQLARVPSMTAEARRLLASVFCRITANDPHGGWAIGNWFYDPLQRPGWLDNPHRPGNRRLHGAGDSWELQWEADPHPDDLAAAMTDPIIGIPGAKIVSAAGQLTITLGDATLRLRSRRA
ncbi:hypothetical protein MUU72_10580 [Streptomyces sp. RS10V-4]|uniref:hypothetical protein n=1 Tax=Streptomyces rhizoryzae TaxID=2932493 RepID=UPI0020044BF9|nr:hypothetical protein [Streptomyces rhizoryzae]MCK7623533.1 hypothetical protein [Streptomyces rhizoryzae]